MPDTDGPRLVKTIEMARIANVSTRLLYTLRTEGCPCIQRGQLLLYEPQRVIDWMRDRYGTEKKTA